MPELDVKVEGMQAATVLRRGDLVILQMNGEWGPDMRERILEQTETLRERHGVAFLVLDQSTTLGGVLRLEEVERAQRAAERVRARIDAKKAGAAVEL